MIGVGVGVGCGGERDGSRDVDREDNNKYINIKSLQSFFQVTLEAILTCN